jgi:hypothetical protein
MNKIIEIGSVILVGMIVIVWGVWVIMPYAQNQNTYVQCCNNQTCSDTYYDYETNLCHLTLCEHNPLMKNCTYEGANITYVGINNTSEWQSYIPSYIPLLITLIFLYLSITYISHYEGMAFGSPIPRWLCIFCLLEKVKILK